MNADPRTQHTTYLNTAISLTVETDAKRGPPKRRADQLI
jgi:hypothetical protein